MKVNIREKAGECRSSSSKECHRPRPGRRDPMFEVATAWAKPPGSGWGSATGVAIIRVGDALIEAARPPRHVVNRAAFGERTLE
jgi:hypothetical protein